MMVTSILTNKRFIFPELAKKMPSFAEKEQHRRSHEGIHDGMSILTFLRIDDPPLFYATLFRHCLEGPRLDTSISNVYTYGLPTLTGLVKLNRLIREFREEPSTYSPQHMRECFDSFR